MKSVTLLYVLTLLLLVACAPASPAAESVSAPLVEEGKMVTIYASPSCGCCGDWMAHMRDNGYVMRVEHVDDLISVKTRYNVPTALRSCHTALVDGYVIEGHVPAEAIERLLDERPDVVGLGVPGMPVGSPGMEGDGQPAQPYDVFTFDEAGQMEIFASYNQ